MKAELVPIDDRDGWKALQAQAEPSVLQQGWAYGAALAGAGALVHRLALVEAGATVGAVQLVGRRVCSGPVMVWHGLGGPSWLRPSAPGAGVAAVRALRRRFGWRRGSLLLLTPAGDDAGVLRAAGLRRAMSGYRTARLDLRGGEAAMLERLTADWRRLLRKGAPSDLVLGWSDPRADPVAVDELLLREAAERRRRRYAGLPPALIGRISRRSPGVLASARVGDTLVGQMLVLTHGSTATYQVGWNDPEGRQRYAHHHLLWGSSAVSRPRAAPGSTSVGSTCPPASCVSSSPAAPFP